MASMTRRRVPPADPAQAANERILAQREKRIIEQEIAHAEATDLGLDLKEKPPESAVEFLRDEFHKKAFGDPKTTTRVIYGPDPLVSKCPEFHDRLERYGQEAVAEAFRELIMTKGELACPDAVMRIGVRKSIERFGKEATAQAFFDRVMRIPSRTVEIDLDDALDPLLSNPMREAVERYGRPGFAVKFLSERCIQVLGLRGYQIVKQDNGDPVKVGTLIMGEIPEAWAERRRQHWAEISQAQVREQEEASRETTARAIHDAGGLQAMREKFGTPGDTVDDWRERRREANLPVYEGTVEEQNAERAQRRPE